MTREQLLKSVEYWQGEIQLNLYTLVEEYLQNNNISRVQFAEMLGVSKGYVSQILNGDFDHRISKLVELCMAIGKVPRVTFTDFTDILLLDAENKLHDSNVTHNNISLTIKATGVCLPTDSNQSCTIINNSNIQNESKKYEIKYSVAV